jgi:predicted S18 family serine protease
MQDVEEKYDNRKLIRNMVEREGSVLIDQMNSRTTDTEGLSTILHVMKTTLSTEILVIVVLFLIAAIAWKRKLV